MLSQEFSNAVDDIVELDGDARRGVLDFIVTIVNNLPGLLRIEKTYQINSRFLQKAKTPATCLHRRWEPQGGSSLVRGHWA
jgi:hypothetical protein